MANDVAHLLRRATYGPTAAELDAATKAGYDATVAALVGPTGTDSGAARTPPPDPGPEPNPPKNATKQERAVANDERRKQIVAAAAWWLDRLAAAEHQFGEKLVFFWHGHWATSVQKVRSARMMLAQQQVFRANNDFTAMAHAMVRDPALLVWLDAGRNTKAAPNENLARELMELFTLGIGNYGEDDVKAAAKALTGWRVNRQDGTAAYEPKAHDAGTVTILGKPGTYDADSLTDLLVHHPACPKFVAARLWYRFASADDPIPDGTRDRVAGAFPDTRAMVRALFTDEAFKGTGGKLAKQPVEWVVGAMRQLGLRPGQFKELAGGLRALGQVPFAPPSVGGWPAGAAWLTTSAAQTRIRLAAAFAAQAQVDKLAGAGKLTPESLAHLLAVDAWTDRTLAVLKTTSDPRRMLALGLASPEYVVT